MKDTTQCGVTVSRKKEEKEAITDKEDLLCGKGFLGIDSSNCKYVKWELILLIHYQIQFISIMGNCSVGLRVGEHKNISERNIRVGEDDRRMGRGSGGGGWAAALPPPPPPEFGQFRFFGQQEKFGQSQFLKKFACVCACCCFFFPKRYFLC